MKEGPGQKALRLSHLFRAVDVEVAHHRLQRSLHVSENPRKAEAPFLSVLFAFDADEDGVCQHVKLTLVKHHGELEGHAGLGSGEPHAVMLVHEPYEVRHKILESVAEIGDGLCLFPENGVGVYPKIQRIHHLAALSFIVF